MRGPWIPRIRMGESSNSIIIDRERDEDDTEGWYLQIGWLGLMVAFEIGSVGRHERMIERWRREEAGCAAKE